MEGQSSTTPQCLSLALMCVPHVDSGLTAGQGHPGFNVQREHCAGCRCKGSDQGEIPRLKEEGGALEVEP